ncbi:uncharacterized protein PHACADRAFT_172279 [Phanerochaete carnosa HHB-10118-sp]|uniref:Uncharacterized protein n=1 Tax=Phanerochaete carnosa (strain HHB-10118-sp) TaxID=650164 RepID=K5VYF8_PHACS|nr:uncharacterized protein PHACADRAFT_172279 [Phanerochaete carnosa HHB-10118-sp]EKM56623.1 hypothetical protein PHACADRAFT_172279 [Phanerochaete carnosa HHB-10118-sp]
MEVVRKARRAGLGDVGRAMELAMFGADIHENSGVPESESHQPKQGRRRGRQPNDGWNGLLESDSDQESAEDSGSEREWEGWEADFTNPRKHRRSLPPDSGVQWESGWHWSSTTSPSKLNGLVSPTGTNFDDYDFPAKPVAAVDAAARSNCASLNVPPRTLSSYASADSLLKRSLQSGSLRRPRRPESPSSYLTHARARSPLAGELDDTEYYGSESGFAVPSPPQYMPDTAYPSRVPAEISLRQASSGYPTQRVPMSMAMTTITSTVTAGDDAGPGRKGKGKGKARALETPPRPARKRSLTVQGALSPRPSTVDSLRDSPGTGTLHTPEGGGERSAKPGRLKLAKLSFAQVAAVSSGSSYLGSRNLAPPPLSATSTSSFESPQFARPEESD